MPRGSADTAGRVSFNRTTIPSTRASKRDHLLMCNIPTLLDWPAESPDLNPIECLWHQLKEFLRSKVKPRTKGELVAGIKLFWSTVVTPELCKRYVEHIRKVAPLVVASGGCATMK
jgi:hypothetical protein